MYPREHRELDLSLTPGRTFLRDLENQITNLDIQQLDILQSDLKSRRTAAKMIQFLQPSQYLQQSPSSQFNGKSCSQIEQDTFELNSSTGQNRISSNNLCVPIIKDLNQERMIQRMKSRTIHQDNSAQKQDSQSSQTDLKTNRISQQKEGSPNMQHLTTQNTQYNFERNNLHQYSLAQTQQQSQSRSQSREKEFLQSTNLNSLENEWSKMKKDHNFDNRSQSPFKFQSQFSPIIGNQNQIVRTSAEVLQRQASNSERSIDSHRKQLEVIETQESRLEINQKQKTLIKKSVPLSKINLEHIKSNQMSQRFVNSSRKTPKNTSQISNNKALTPQSSNKILNNSNSNNSPHNLQGNFFKQSASASSLPAKNGCGSLNQNQEPKEEAHFQTILDKYSNIHKKQGYQQIKAVNLSSSYISNSENPGSSFEILAPPQQYQQQNSNCQYQPPSSKQQQQQQQLQSYQGPHIIKANIYPSSSLPQNEQSQYNSSFLIHKSSHNILQQVQTNKNTNSPSNSNNIYNFSTKVADTNAYHNPSPNPIQLTSGLATQSPISSRQQILSQVSNDRCSSIEGNRQNQDAQKFHNSIKIMSPKSNDLKVITNRNTNNLSNYVSTSNITHNFNVSTEQIQSQYNQENNFQQPTSQGILESDAKQKRTIQQQQQQQQQQIQYQQINIVKERDVKQLIMSKIHKMNVTKIFLKEEESGQNISSISSGDASTLLSTSNEPEINKAHNSLLAQFSPNSSMQKDLNNIPRQNSPNLNGFNGSFSEAAHKSDGLRDLDRSHGEILFRGHHNEQPPFFQNQLNFSTSFLEKQATENSNFIDQYQTSMKKKSSNSNLQQNSLLQQGKNSCNLNQSNLLRGNQETHQGGNCFLGQSNILPPSISQIPYQIQSSSIENYANTANQNYEGQNNQSYKTQYYNQINNKSVSTQSLNRQNTAPFSSSESNLKHQNTQNMQEY